MTAHTVTETERQAIKGCGVAVGEQVCLRRGITPKAVVFRDGALQERELTAQETILLLPWKWVVAGMHESRVVLTTRHPEQASDRAALFDYEHFILLDAVSPLSDVWFPGWMFQACD